jgi:DNA-binding transcriptional ArsR family regulator
LFFILVAVKPSPSKHIKTRSTRRKGTSRVSVGVPREEARIQKWLTKALMREPVKQGCTRVVCSELNVSSGIADVVSATVTADPVQWLSARVLREVNLTTTKVLAQLKCRRYVSVIDVTKTVGISWRTAMQHLRMLERLGLAKLKGDSVMLLIAAKTHFKHVDAYEVKVSDWRHGLYQATHYRSFANRVSVALPDKKARAVARNSQPFRTFGVGLVGVTSYSLKWYLKPVRRPASSESKALFGVMQILRTRQAKALRTLAASQ